MARRKKGGEEEGKERWLITYADMITLLLALFIVMYAISDVDARKFEAIAKSIREGFGATSPGGAVPVFESGATAPFSGSGIADSIPFEVFAYRRIKKIEEELQRLAREAGGQFEMKYTERGIEISIYPSQILFDTASAKLKPQFQEILRKLGAEVVLCGPPTFMPKDVGRLGVSVDYDLGRALRGAQVVNILRIQRERQESGLLPSLRAYARDWQVRAEHLDLMDPEGIVMHPGPMNRGIEIAQGVADGPRSVILEQVTNGVAVRMAVLYLLSRARRRLEEDKPADQNQEQSEVSP